MTCSNGVGSGLIVPGTGLHLNNMMGEQDLNPLGFHQFPAGRRMPSMMSPTIVQRDDEVELALGSAGSNRIRSAIIQTLLGVVERGLPVQEAVEAARVHFEDGTVYAEPGVDVAALEASGHTVQTFRAPNVFFGGVQAVERDPATGALTGGGDPRRGGSVAVACAASGRSARAAWRRRASASGRPSARSAPSSRARARRLALGVALRGLGALMGVSVPEALVARGELAERGEHLLAAARRSTSVCLQ